MSCSQGDRAAVVAAAAAAALLVWAFLLLPPALAVSDMKTYLVHVKENLRSASENQAWHLALIANATDLASPADINQRLIYSYSLAFHGFSALLTASEASKLGQIEEVVTLYEASVSALHTTRTPSFLQLSNSVLNSNASGPLWSASARGANIIIGVIDTGVWPEHPSFSDVGLAPIAAGKWNGSCHPSIRCNNKIIGARHFSAGYVAELGHPINESLEFNSPRDSEGHGTHTASTAAGAPIASASYLGFASGAASGIAPLARLSIYKACWLGGCFDVDILAAIEAAISDGVHIISLSLGSNTSTEYSSDGVALGSFAAVSRGITVVASAGNDGPELGTVTNGPPWILTVAASSVDRDFPAPVTLGNGSVYVGSSLYVGQGTGKLKPLIQAKDAVVAGGNVEYARYCLGSRYLNAAAVSGKVVVCEEGYVSNEAKGVAVAVAGGDGTIVVNAIGSREDLIADAFVTPAARVGYLEGASIKEYIGKSTTAATARIDFNGTRLNVRAPLIASFSSRGPHLTSIQIAKPDITGPGLNILAAWPSLTNNSFNIISGTSMSCPHLSGLTALLKAAHPTWSPAAIRSALMTTSTTRDNQNLPILDLATLTSANPLQFGSGHVRPNLALNPGLIYDIQPQAYVDFLCALDPSGSLLLQYSRGSSCSKPLPSISDLNYPSFSVIFDQSLQTSSTLSASFRRIVTNVGLPTSVYNASLILPSGVKSSISPPILSFNALSQSLSYSITFTAPRYASSNILVGFGSLIWSDGKNYDVQSPITFYWFP